MAANGDTLYESSLGHVEFDLDPELDVVSAWLFDDDGRVARGGGDEWTWADPPDLLVEVGLPEAEAQSIAAQFLEAAKAERHEQPDVSSPFGNAVGLAVLTGIVIFLGIGVWTVVTWIA